MQQQDSTRVRRLLAFSISALIVTASGAMLTFVVGLKILGVALAVLAIFNLVNVVLILVQMRRRGNTLR